MERRTFIKGIAGIIAAASAPAIIPIKSIMPVKPIVTPGEFKTMYSKVIFSNGHAEFEDILMKELANAMAISVDEMMIGLNSVDYSRGHHV